MPHKKTLENPEMLSKDTKPISLNRLYNLKGDLPLSIETFSFALWFVYLAYHYDFANPLQFAQSPQF